MSSVWYVWHSLFILFGADDSARRTIEAAMEQIMSDSEDCVHFRPKRTLDLDYVHFFPGEG